MSVQPQCSREERAKMIELALGARMRMTAAVMHEPTGQKVRDIENHPIAVPFRKIAPAPLTPNPVFVAWSNHHERWGCWQRRDFLLTVAGSIAGLAIASWPARVLAQPAGGSPLRISTIGAGREGGALGALFVKAGHRVMFSSRHPDTLKG